MDSRRFKMTTKYALLLFLCLLPLIMRGNTYYLHVYIVCAINVILASSLRMMATTGQMSIGQAGFMAIGAYASAVLTMKAGVPVCLSVILGGVAGAVIALMIGFPLSRIRTVYFVTVTMFLGEIIRLVLFEWSSLTGGSTGLMGIPGLGTWSFFGLFQIDFTNKLHFAYLMLIVVICVLLILYNLHRSHAGTVLAAIGQEESLSSSVGINVASYKVLIFCVGCFFTGLAGSLYAHYMTVLNPDAFGVFTSLYILIYVVVGGKKFSGPIAGAIILTLVPELFAVMKEYQPYIFVLVLFLIVFLLPGGIVELPRRIIESLKKTPIEEVR
jgi:branched-chain amino acid transport system permease protein